MPNWCSNSIIIYGNNKVLSEISNKIKTIDNTKIKLFETLVGLPPTDLKKVIFTPNYTYWGTKWDVFINTEDISEDFEGSPNGTIIINCETAWSPPIEFCEKLSKQYGVNVEIEYSEPGCDFYGKMFIEYDGDFTEEQYGYMEGIYIFQKEQFWDEILNFYGPNIIEEFNESPTDNQLNESINVQFSFCTDTDKIEIFNIIKTIINE